jgi:hypothetical protein
MRVGSERLAPDYGIRMEVDFGCRYPQSAKQPDHISFVHLATLHQTVYAVRDGYPASLQATQSPATEQSEDNGPRRFGCRPLAIVAQREPQVISWYAQPMSPILLH